MKKEMFNKLISLAIATGMVTNLILPVKVFAIPEENKISLEVIERMESSDSKIPVVIWNKSVSDNDIEKNVKNEIGFSLDDIEEKYDAPNQELLDELSNAANSSPDKYLETLMKTHMEITSESRKIEKQKTDLYLKTRRKIVADYYSERNNDFLTEEKIDSDSVMFTSMYAPMIIAFLSYDEIEKIAESKDVEEITLYKETKNAECSFPNTNLKNIMGINQINQYLSLTGDGVDIGIYEESIVTSTYNYYDLDMNKVHLISPNYTAPNIPHHATWCASVAAGYYGVAPDADIYTATSHSDVVNFDWSGNNMSLPYFEALITYGVKLINLSWGMYYSTGNVYYDNFAKYFDQIIKNTKITVVCSTGNNYDDPILTPAASYNCIAVNAFSVENNVEVLERFSYDNGYSGMKPDVIAYTFGLGGTSTAAPVITGMLALLLEYKPCLSAHPELNKAILMASCHRKATKLYNENGTISDLNEPLSAGLSSHQGAGIPNMYTMISIASQHSYGGGILSSNEINIPITQPKYGAENMNIAMTYLQDNISIFQNYAVTSNDYDMYLTSGNTTKSSVLSNSSTELIYTNLFSANDKYNLKINKTSNSASNLYGYAWSTDQAKFIPTLQEEGLYHLRNFDGNYMISDPQNNRCILGNYSSNYDGTWILRYNSSNGKYTLQSASGSSYGMTTGNTITGNYKHICEGTSANASQISIIFNDDGSYTFIQNFNGSVLALGKYMDKAAWCPYSSNDNSQKWYLESLQYRRGDVNMDGSINTTDATIVLNHVNYSVPITVNINKFLADANLDHNISITDMSYIANGLC